MAHHKSAQKRIRRNEARRRINHSRISRVRTFVRKVEAAIMSGNRDAAREALQLAQPEIHRGVTRGVMHRNTAARRISKLAKRINAMPV